MYVCISKTRSPVNYYKTCNHKFSEFSKKKLKNPRDWPLLANK